jgi:hypothetical protein
MKHHDTLRERCQQSARETYLKELGDELIFACWVTLPFVLYMFWG